MMFTSIAAHARTTTPRRAAVALGALASVSLAVAGAGSVAADDVSKCGAVVTTDVRLTADLVDCPGPALVIGAPGLTIDLGGHVIDGVGAGAGIDGNGEHDRITITNGTIREFGRGIELLDNDGTRVTDVALESNGIGIAAGRTDRLDIDRVTATGNSFAGLSLTFGDDARVRRSTIDGSGFGGIIDRFSDGSRYDGNVVTANAFFGITMTSATNADITGNEVRGNLGDGIQLGFRAEDNRVTANLVVANAGSGIVVEEPGNVVARNGAFDNTGVGILAADGTVDPAGNTAAGNAGGDCIGLVCD